MNIDELNKLRDSRRDVLLQRREIILKAKIENQREGICKAITACSNLLKFADDKGSQELKKFKVDLLKDFKVLLSFYNSHAADEVLKRGGDDGFL